MILVLDAANQECFRLNATSDWLCPPLAVPLECICDICQILCAIASLWICFFYECILMYVCMWVYIYVCWWLCMHMLTHMCIGVLSNDMPTPLNHTDIFLVKSFLIFNFGTWFSWWQPPCKKSCLLWTNSFVKLTAHISVYNYINLLHI